MIMCKYISLLMFFHELQQSSNFMRCIKNILLDTINFNYVWMVIKEVRCLSMIKNQDYDVDIIT